MRQLLTMPRLPSRFTEGVRTNFLAEKIKVFKLTITTVNLQDSGPNFWNQVKAQAEQVVLASMLAKVVMRVSH